MTLIYEELMATSTVDLNHTYGDTETMLYAQSVGFGRDPVAHKELPYVHEQGLPLRTIPTMATVLVPDLIPSDLGWDYTQVLHAEQRLQLHRPLPAAAEILVNKRVVEVFDRGPKRGAMILFEAEVTVDLAVNPARGRHHIGRHVENPTSVATAPRAKIKRYCSDLTAIETRCTLILQQQRQPGFLFRFCTGSAPTASPVTRF
jgi:hypothetical protein